MNIVSVCCLSIILGLFCGIKISAVELCLIFIGLIFVIVIKSVIFRRNKYGNICAVIVIALFFGGAFCGFAYDRHQFADMNKMYGSYVTVSGTVTKCIDNGFVLDDGKYSYNIYIYGDDTETNEYDTVTVSGKLTDFSSARFKGDMDSRLYHALKGICGKISAESIKITGHDDSFSIQRSSSIIRGFVNERIDSNRYYSDKSFMKALLTGTTDDLDDDIKENFRLTGISHLLAVSGLHFGIFLSFFSVVTGRIRRHRVPKYLFTILLIFVYVLMVGSRASVFRAAFMVAAGGTAGIFRRRSDSLTNLMLSGLGICFVNPYYVTDPGFQMSFTATLGIVLFSEYFKNKVIAVPIISLFFMMPITVYYSNVISLESVIVNIASVALIPAVIAFGYISCIIPIFAVGANLFSVLILSMAEVFSNIGFLHISVPSPGITVFVYWFMAVCFVYFALDGFRFDDMMTLILCCVLVSSYLYASTYDMEKSSKVCFINSGICNTEHIITENGRNIFVDCGYNADSYALKNGVREIYMIIIANDNQSRYSGLEEMCRTHKVEVVLLPDSMRNRNLNLENTKVLYYNQNSYKYAVDNVKIKSTVKNKTKCLMVSVYSQVIAIPVGTRSIKNAAGCDIICVPNNCTDCSEFASVSGAHYYVHATCNYDYYDYGNKYITSREGIVKMKFYNYRNPVISTGSSLVR